jgi:hypothetical protein
MVYMPQIVIPRRRKIVSRRPKPSERPIYHGPRAVRLGDQDKTWNL